MANPADLGDDDEEEEEEECSACGPTGDLSTTGFSTFPSKNHKGSVPCWSIVGAKGVKTI